ncbi:MAG: RNA polymerase factor sigma-32 [Myxococcales bacterium]|nr:RNA polymerase factor sigma-32 [Myxococcales bacterium]
MAKKIQPETALIRSPQQSLVTTGPLETYLARLRELPLLTPEEEYNFAVDLFENGNKEAGVRLVLGNLRLVVKIAFEYRRQFMQVMDLIQEGNIGLMQAVAKFNPYKDVKLSSYASWWIRAYIIRYILNNWKMVKIGTTQAQRKLFFNLKKEKARLEARGIVPTAQLIGQSLHVSEREVVEMEGRLGSNDVSLDMPVGEKGKETVSDLFPAHESQPDEAIAVGQERRMVREAIADLEPRLSDKEKFILYNRLLTDEPLTLQEIGNEFSFSRERARKIESGLLDKMRGFFQRRGLSAEQYDAR